MSVRSGVLGVGVLMPKLHLLVGRCVVWVFLGVSRGVCAGDGWGKYRLCWFRGGGDLIIDRIRMWVCRL